MQKEAAKSGQASVGVLMLQTCFPRPLGDIGNALSWDFPVHYRVVEGASARKVVLQDPSELFDAFVTAGRELVEAGCAGITTSCGFLGLMQDELKSALGVPFASSSLMQVPMVEAVLPAGKRAGVLTISAEGLTPAHLAAAGAFENTPLQGMNPQGAFARPILEDLKEMDFEACRRDMLEAATELTKRHSDVGAIVLECTNMVPHAADIASETGLPVYSIHSFVRWFHAGLSPSSFPKA